MQEIILNGMNKDELKEGLESAILLQQGFSMLIDQIAKIETGEVVTNSEIRKAKLKLNEAIFIMNDLKESQSKSESLYKNANKPLNRDQRRNKKR